MLRNAFRAALFRAALFRAALFRAALVGLALLALLVTALPALAQASTGSASFNNYVAMGDSLTAGFMSGGLMDKAQVNSYPALIYRQVNGRTTGFEQPLVSSPGIPALLELRSLVPLSVGQPSGTGQPLNLTLPRPYNNLAVPGADVHDVLATVTGGLHDLILRGAGTQLQQALVQRPSFVTLWIGNNDALAAATSGIINDATLTPLASFTADYQAVINAVNATGAKMAIANIPNVTAIPFVTTLPPVVVNPATSQPVLVNGNPVPLIGPNGLLTSSDRVLLSATAEMQRGFGIPQALGGNGQPLSDAAVLSASEISTINARVAAFNAVIQSEANRVGAAFVDANAVLNRAATTGIPVGGMTFTSSFLTGGIFSYDGIHPTPFGYAYVANLFINAINDKFGGEIPLLNLSPFIFNGFKSLNASLPAGQMWVEMDSIALRNLFWALNVHPESATAPTKPGRGRQGGRHGNRH